MGATRSLAIKDADGSNFWLEVESKLLTKLFSEALLQLTLHLQKLRSPRLWAHIQEALETIGLTLAFLDFANQQVKANDLEPRACPRFPKTLGIPRLTLKPLRLLGPTLFTFPIVLMAETTPRSINMYISDLILRHNHLTLLLDT